VVAHSAAFDNNAVKQFDKFNGIDRKAGFFAQFADEGVLKGFAQLNHPSGQRPLALAWRFAAADEQHAAAMDDYGAYSDKGQGRKFAAHESSNAFTIALQTSASASSGVNLHRAAIINKERDIMAEFQLKIEGMHCGGCVRRVSQALAGTEGIVVDEVTVGSARLHSESEPAPVEAAIAALAKAGYTARLEG
jgi:copper chaperone